MKTPKQLASCILSCALLLTSPGVGGVEAFAAALLEAPPASSSARIGNAGPGNAGFPIETLAETLSGPPLSILDEGPSGQPDLNLAVTDAALAGPPLAIEVAAPVLAVGAEAKTGVLPPPSQAHSHMQETGRARSSPGTEAVSEREDGEPEVGAVSRPAARVVGQTVRSLDAVNHPTSTDGAEKAIRIMVDGSAGAVSTNISAVSATPGAEDGPSHVVFTPQLAPNAPQQGAPDGTEKASQTMVDDPAGAASSRQGTQAEQSRAPPDAQADFPLPSSRGGRWLAAADGLLGLFSLLGAAPKDAPPVRDAGGSVVYAALAIGAAVAVAATGLALYPLVKRWLRRLRERRAVAQQWKAYQEWKKSPQRTLIMMAFTEPADRSYLEGIDAYHERFMVGALEALDGKTDVIYVTARPYNPLAWELILQTLDEERREAVRKRVHFFSANVDPKTHITPQLLNQPAKIEALADLVKSKELNHPTLLRPLRAGPWEWKLFDELAVRTGVMKTVDGPLPHLEWLGNKWGNFIVFTKALAWQIAHGVPPEHRIQFPDTKLIEPKKKHPDRRLAQRIVQLIEASPGTRHFMVKILDMSSGAGNMSLDLSGLPEGSVTVDDVMRLLPHAPKEFFKDGMDWELYKVKMENEGAVVQNFIVGAEGAPSPSTQVNEGKIISSFIQILRPPKFQIYLGASFPAEPRMRQSMLWAMEAVNAVMVESGWILGRYSVDFVAVSKGKDVATKAVELNGRAGGTTAPFDAAIHIAGASRDEATGDLFDRHGKRIVFTALDHQPRPNLRLVEKPAKAEIREKWEKIENDVILKQFLEGPGRRFLYDPKTGKGLVPNMASAVVDAGNGMEVGTVIGHSAAEVARMQAELFHFGNQLEIMHMTTERREIVPPGEENPKRYLARATLSSYSANRGTVVFSEFKDDEGKLPPTPRRKKKRRNKAPSPMLPSYATPSPLRFKMLAEDSRKELTHLSETDIHERLQDFLADPRWQGISYDPITRQGIIFHPTGYTIIAATDTEISNLHRRVKGMLTAFRIANRPSDRTIGRQ